MNEPRRSRPGHGRRPERGAGLAVGCVVLAALCLAACGGRTVTPTVAPPSTAVSSTTSEPVDGAIVDGAVGAAVRAAMPGLYLPDDVDVRALPSGAFAVHAGGSCDALREVLRAGDWSVADELVVPVAADGTDSSSMLAIGGISPMLVMRQGQDVVAALTSGGADGCDATISRAVTGPVEVSGSSLSATGPGWTSTMRCLAVDDLLDVTVVVGAPGASALLSFELSGSGTERQVVAGDAGDSFVVTGAVGVLGVMSQFFSLAAAQADEGDVPPGFDPATLHTLSSESDALGVATLDPGADAADAIPSGSLVLTGFVTDDDGQAVRLAFPFRCADVVRLSM